MSDDPPYSTNFPAGFWTERYLSGETGWDLGQPSPPIIEFVTTRAKPQDRILIPGAGNAYEAEFLYLNGFTNIHVLDISQEPLKAFIARLPKFPENQLLLGDFFDHQGRYDLILEQTFFCALKPVLRPSYVKKMIDLLVPGGTLAGVWFDFPLDPAQNMPPFGGSAQLYQTLFSPFEIHCMEPCRNSVSARLGQELFCIFHKPGTNNG